MLIIFALQLQNLVLVRPESFAMHLCVRQWWNFIPFSVLVAVFGLAPRLLMNTKLSWDRECLHLHYLISVKRKCSSWRKWWREMRKGEGRCCFNQELFLNNKSLLQTYRVCSVQKSSSTPLLAYSRLGGEASENWLKATIVELNGAARCIHLLLNGSCLVLMS